MIIADTGFWVALANRRDRHHELAKKRLSELAEPLVSTWPVVTETCYLLLDRLGSESQQKFLLSMVDTAFEVFDRLCAWLPRSGRDMARSKGEGLPTGSIDELVALFDTHDMGAYWDDMPEVHFDVDIKHRAHLVAVDDDLVDRIAEVARTKHVSSESLINSLLREKLAEAI